MKPPIDILPLMPELNDKLISLLKGLPPDSWQKQTVAKKWVVKDVVSHLLDVNLRRVALHRDGWQVPPATPIRSYQDLVDFLNNLNGDWVEATRRLSPRILIEMLESASNEALQIFQRLDPFSPAAFPVSWAGEEHSQNWFDIAREYTERWLHQQQIRQAIGDKELLTEKFYHPLLHIFLQAWPYTLKDSTAETGQLLRTVITGNGGGEWFVQRGEEGWALLPVPPAAAEFAATSTIDGDIAWILFSKSIRKTDIAGQFEIHGDQVLGEKVLDMISVMA